MEVLSSAFNWFLRSAAAALLVSSAVLHLTNPYFFLGSVLRYELTGPTLSMFIATVLPAASLVVGCLLVLGFWQRIGLMIAAFLFIVFGIAQWSVLLSGRIIACGCFGAFSEVISPVTAGIVSVFGMMLLVTGLCAEPWSQRVR